MNPATDGATDFQWLSLLGASVGLFLVVGLLLLAIGLITPFTINMEGALAVTERTDTAYLGDSPQALLAADPALGKLRAVLIMWLAGAFTAVGILSLSLAWFGVREGRAWALVALTIAVVGSAVIWVASLIPYTRAGVRFTFGEVPPFIWVPGALVVPATILGWIGSR